MNPEPDVYDKAKRVLWHVIKLPVVMNSYRDRIQLDVRGDCLRMIGAIQVFMQPGGRLFFQPQDVHARCEVRRVSVS